ncbi:phosphopantetheine-binding protein [Chitinilyticum piscinae]|uniref:phosphopantetheine-binding protein n=1 Tax=Chitinilyticum piscinae TaxID=2866724 RepID=UPI0027E42003|nr:phosphopantetheine-binding protein [Chitinilyticum piscinae]
MDSALINEIKCFVIETLNLEDMTADEIDTDAPLFNDGLGLDSIDALELGVALQKKYGIKLQSDAAENRAHFASIAALAELVSHQRKQ